MRYFIDAILVIILLALSSFLVNIKEQEVAPLNNRIENFEEKIGDGEFIEQSTTQQNAIFQTQENKAARLGEQTSDLIVNAIKASMEVAASIMDGFLE